MLITNNFNPATWIQAVLLSEIAGQTIDAGGIYYQPTKRINPSQTLFGDDTIPNQKPTQYGWEIRSPNGFYIPGSIVTIRITRPIVEYALSTTLIGKRRTSPYIKAILRKHIRKLSHLPNEPPKDDHIEDIFITYEQYFKEFTKTIAKKPKSKPPLKSSTQITSPPTAPSTTPQEQPTKQRNPLLSFID